MYKKNPHTGDFVFCGDVALYFFKEKKFFNDVYFRNIVYFCLLHDIFLLLV